MAPGGATVFSTTTSTGTDLRRADFIGQLNLVTPLHIEATLINTVGLVEFRPGAAFVRLNLHFVPEPGAVALVLGALLALVLGFRRQRRVSR